VVTYRFGAVTTLDDKIPATVRAPVLAVIEPRATTEVLAVIVDELKIPSTVNVPALAVIEPK